MTNSSSSAGLYRYGLSLGTTLLRHGHARHALPWLLRPVNYWRAAEYHAVWDEAGFGKDDRILDVGSPKLLSLYLAERLGAEVWATDIEPYFLEKLALAKQLRGLGDDRLHLAVEDGRKLSFKGDSFSRV